MIGAFLGAAAVYLIYRDASWPLECPTFGQPDLALIFDRPGLVLKALVQLVRTA